MYPGLHARSHPDKPAVIMGASGQTVTFAQLDERSNRLARLWHEAGLRPGDHVALFLENHPRYFEVVWAALRSGLYLTTVNRYLTQEEAGYIVDNSEAQALVTSSTLADVAAGLPARAQGCRMHLMMDGAIDGFERYEDAIGSQALEPLDDQPLGAYMLYSSGTTGRPKGILRPLSGRQVEDGDGSLTMLMGVFGIDEKARYLSPAPLYHAAPLGFSVATTAVGGTVVVMEHFDPVDALAFIEQHQVTHSQWVPTMFVRMLKLPEADRTAYDLSSHQVAVHAAAPCPVAVKEGMIDWWGPILMEYYAGTELNGFTLIDSQQWLAHKGSVGRPLLGTIHICDDGGVELEAGQAGEIYFEQPDVAYVYFKDEAKTSSSQHPEHPNWTSLGDVGFVDEEGWLFLTDRSSFMIISGGVNIYPQEIENLLIGHPAVLDVAVIGVPHPEFGEAVKAVVQTVDADEDAAALEQTLITYAREHLAGYKVPRSVDVVDELPRLPTGKLYKRKLRDQYWQDAEGRAI